MDAKGQPPATQQERLESWKEIAAYLGKSVRTVVRWEKTEGLPIHRHQHERRASVYCDKSEIDAWWRKRRADLDTPAEVAPIHRRSRIAVGIGGVTILSGIAVALLLIQRDPPPPMPLKSEPLTAYPGAQCAPTFSPDGSQFAFVWDGPKLENCDIYVQTVGAGTEPKRLTDHPLMDFSPAWSPDGRWIAFLRRTRDKHVWLYLTPASGGGERKIADLQIAHYNESTGICWTSDSKSLIVGDGDRGDYGLYVYTLDTGEKRQLTHAKLPREHLDPALSPDGKSVAFRCENNDSKSEICLLALDENLRPAGQPVRVTSLGQRSTSPVWVGGGRDLVFSSGVLISDSNLYRTTVFPARNRTGKVQQLTWGAEEQFSVSTSRRGDLMAYTRRRSESNIWSVNWNPTTRHAQAPESLLSSNRVDMEPDFSPNGSMIAFASDRSGSMEIWVAQPDGSRARKLTSFAPHPANAPRWSPDGTKIAFAVREGGEDAIYLIGSEGGPVQKLVKMPNFVLGLRCLCQPSWSPDGKWIYYTAPANEVNQVFRIPVEGGNHQQITTAGGCNPQSSTDGQHIFYTADDGLWKVAPGGGQREHILKKSWSHSAVSIAIVRDGIFILPLFGDDAWTLDFYRFSDGSVAPIASGDKRTTHGLAVSPDGRHILLSLRGALRTNLMLVRNPQ